MFEIRGLSNQECASLRDVIASRLFTSARTVETVIGQVDKYVTGRLDGKPADPAPCFIAPITRQKNMPERSTKAPTATAAAPAKYNDSIRAFQPVLGYENMPRGLAYVGMAQNPLSHATRHWTPDENSGLLWA